MLVDLTCELEELQGAAWAEAGDGDPYLMAVFLNREAAIQVLEDLTKSPTSNVHGEPAPAPPAPIEADEVVRPFGQIRGVDMWLCDTPEHASPEEPWAMVVVSRVYE